AGRLDDAVVQLDESTRVDPAWSGTPLNAALRQLAERARPKRDAPATRSGESRLPEKSPPINASRLQDELSRKKAAWQFRLEATLLGSERDASRSVLDQPTQAGELIR